MHTFMLRHTHDSRHAQKLCVLSPTGCSDVCATGACQCRPHTHALAHACTYTYTSRNVRCIYCVQVAAGICEAEEVLGGGARGPASVAGVVHIAQGRLLAPARRLQPQAAHLHHAPPGEAFYPQNVRVLSLSHCRHLLDACSRKQPTFVVPLQVRFSSPGLWNSSHLGIVHEGLFPALCTF